MNKHYTRVILYIILTVPWFEMLNVKFVPMFPLCLLGSVKPYNVHGRGLK